MISTNIFINLSAAAILGAAIVGSQFLEKSDLKAQSTNSSKEQIDLAEKELSARLKLLQHSPTIGFDNLLADSVFVQFLQYFGDDEAREQVGYAKSPEFFETLISLDPHYRDFYIFLSGSSTLYAGKPEKTVQLMASGLSQLSPNQPPDSYYIWRYKAVDELLFLGDTEAAQNSYNFAADWAAQSTNEGAEQISHLSKQTAHFLAESPNSKNAQIDAWGSLLTTALDKTTRDHAIKRIKALGGNVIVSEEGGIQIKYEQEEDTAQTSRDSDV